MYLVRLACSGTVSLLLPVFQVFISLLQTLNNTALLLYIVHIIVFEGSTYTCTYTIASMSPICVPRIPTILY